MPRKIYNNWLFCYDCWLQSAKIDFAVIQSVSQSVSVFSFKEEAQDFEKEWKKK